MKTAINEWAVILRSDYYGPKTSYTLICLHDTAAEAEAVVAAQTARVMLSHNQYAESTDVYAVIGDIDTDDWMSWPSDMFKAAVTIGQERGIDTADSEAVERSEIDWAHEAAEAIDCCVVTTDDDRLLLCKFL